MEDGIFIKDEATLYKEQRFHALSQSSQGLVAAYFRGEKMEEDLMKPMMDCLNMFTAEGPVLMVKQVHYLTAIEIVRRQAEIIEKLKQKLLEKESSPK